MRLGYERIVKDKRILISVEVSDDPWVTLNVDGNKDIRFKASEKPENLKIGNNSEMHKVIQQIIDAVHEAYVKSTSESYIIYYGIR